MKDLLLLYPHLNDSVIEVEEVVAVVVAVDLVMVTVVIDSMTEAEEAVLLPDLMIDVVSFMEGVVVDLPLHTLEVVVMISIMVEAVAVVLMETSGRTIRLVEMFDI